MHDVVIVDEEFNSAAKIIETTSKQIDTLIDEYIKTLNEACCVGIRFGETAMALRTFTSYAEKLKGLAGEFAKQHRTMSTDFLNVVDRTDSYFYD